MERNIFNTLKLGVACASMIIFFNACDLREKGGKAANEVANAGSKNVDSCDAYNTESVADAQNEVVLPTKTYKFHLYWLGRDSNLSVWENHALNEYYKAAFNPVVLKFLDQQTQEEVSQVICDESKDSAEKCIDRFEKLTQMIDDAKESAQRAGAQITNGREMTFKCARDFAQKKINALKTVQ